jgi:small subunit ribosomal protein S5e
MMEGRNNGKKQMAMRHVKQTFDIIHLLTGQNPIQVLVDALSQGGAREDSTRIGSGGTVRRQAVDVSPLRRVNQGIYLILKGVRASTFRSMKSLSECLADEIIQAAKAKEGLSNNSHAVRKKEEIERVSKGNR